MPKYEFMCERCKRSLEVVQEEPGGGTDRRYASRNDN